MYAQIIDDTVGKTLVSASTLQKDVKEKLEKTNDVAAAAGYDTQNIKRNIVFFQQPHGFHNSIERILSLHICSIAVMQLWRSVQRQPHQKMVFRKKRGPFLINGVAVGLYGIIL